MAGSASTLPLDYWSTRPRPLIACPLRASTCQSATTRSLFRSATTTVEPARGCCECQWHDNGECGGCYISSVPANESLSTREELSECLSVDSACNCSTPAVRTVQGMAVRF